MIYKTYHMKYGNLKKITQINLKNIYLDNDTNIQIKIDLTENNLEYILIGEKSYDLSDYELKKHTQIFDIENPEYQEDFYIPSQEELEDISYDCKVSIDENTLKMEFEEYFEEKYSSNSTLYIKDTLFKKDDLKKLKINFLFSKSIEKDLINNAYNLREFFENILKDVSTKFEIDISCLDDNKKIKSVENKINFYKNKNVKKTSLLKRIEKIKNKTYIP